VLPGWVLPAAEGRAALAHGAAALRAHGVAAGRRAILCQPVDPALAGELRSAATGLGGRVIVRSSSPLESDPRWAGAFSSVAGAGPDDIVPAVRSCWASAFAVDPLRRLEACGLPPEAAELAILIQPEISPRAGGTARVAAPGRPRGDSAGIIVEGVRGHPGALLAGWAEGASARISGGMACAGSGTELASLIGSRTAGAVAGLAYRVHQELGDDTIEWAAWNGKIWLLQSLRSGRLPPQGDQSARTSPAAEHRDAACPAASAGIAHAVTALEGVAGSADGPALAAAIPAAGQRVSGTPAAPGIAVGYLRACRPHERVHGPHAAILLIDRPLPAYAPLLYGVRGVVARTGSGSSHLAEIARSLRVPMVTGCRLHGLAAPPRGPGNWLAAINGDTGDVSLLACGTGR
jgi:pyruvate,water dikinase